MVAGVISELAQLVAAVAGLAAVVVAFLVRKTAREMKLTAGQLSASVSTVDRVAEVADTIHAQVTSNGGSSLRDAVNNANFELFELGKRLDAGFRRATEAQRTLGARMDDSVRDRADLREQIVAIAEQMQALTATVGHVANALHDKVDTVVEAVTPGDVP